MDLCLSLEVIAWQNYRFQSKMQEEGPGQQGSRYTAAIVEGGINPSPIDGRLALQFEAKVQVAGDKGRVTDRSAQRAWRRHNRRGTDATERVPPYRFTGHRHHDCPFEKDLPRERPVPVVIRIHSSGRTGSRDVDFIELLQFFDAFFLHHAYFLGNMTTGSCWTGESAR